MGFEVLSGAPSGKPPINKDHVALLSGKNPMKKGAMTYRLVIGQRVVDRLGWTGETLIQVLWGTGEDFGKIRLAPDPQKGFAKVRVNKTHGSAKLFIGSLPESCAHVAFLSREVVFQTLAVAQSTQSLKNLTVELPPEFFRAEFRPGAAIKEAVR